MKPKYTSILLGIILLATIGKAFSQETHKSVFWSIISPNSGDTSYILGTIHGMDTAQISFPTEVIRNKLNKCEVYVSEVNQKSINAFMLGKFDPSSGINKDPIKKIKNSLEKESLAYLKEISSNFKMFTDLYPKLDAFKPQIVALFVILEKQMQSPHFKSLNFEPDKYFEKFSKKKGIDRVGLENPQSQIDFLYDEGLSFEDGIQELKNALIYFKETDQDIYQQYVSQDLSHYTEISKSKSITKRNKEMVLKLAEIIESEPVFFAVGVAHLSGNTGILTLLEQRGFEVNPVKIDLEIKK